MKSYEIVTDLDIDGPGTQDGTAIDMSTENHPFAPGNSCLAVGAVVAFAEDAEGSVDLEGRESTSDSWEVLASFGPGAAPLKITEIVITRYLRYSETSATAADGRASIYLLGN